MDIVTVGVLFDAIWADRLRSDQCRMACFGLDALVDTLYGALNGLDVCP